MGDTYEIKTDKEEPYNMFKANSGAISFKVNSCGPVYLTLFAKEYPRIRLVEVTIDNSSSINNFIGRRRKTKVCTPNLLSHDENTYTHLWLTWHSGLVRFGRIGEEEPILSCVETVLTSQMVGFIKFTSGPTVPTSWIFDGVTPPERPLPLKKQIKTGKLRWAPITDPLPTDALIGGMEQKPTYIARAHHEGSLVPGKYLPWLNLCYIPWDRREFTKQVSECEILCGYDVEWVWTMEDKIPQNAVMGGYSMLHREPLYVGRAHEAGGSHIVPGRVHAHYKSCYVPYMRQEHPVSRYQILVSQQRELSGLMTPKGDW